MNKNKDVCHAVPQGIARHFIEPTAFHRDTTAIITLDQNASTDNEDDEEEEDEGTLYDSDQESSTLYQHSISDSSEEEFAVSQPSKWSFMRGLFSKLRLNNHTNPPTAAASSVCGDGTANLSTYGTLIDKHIGEGVSARVQLIQRQDETFAVKMFRKRKRRETLVSYMKALAGEFCIASALNHKNVVKTLDFVRSDNDSQRYSIVMEYCSEGDMYALIKQGNLEDDAIFSYFKQLLQGLDYLHSLGVAHRDLKPENLLIQNGVLKIADFGAADVFRVAWQEHSRLSDGLCGTTPYMAPEVFLDQGYWAAPVDVWAAGIILFCMKFDGVPFGSAELTDTNYPIYLRKRPLRQYDPINKLAREPRMLMYAMLNPDCNRRITIQDALDMPWMQTIY